MLAPLLLQPHHRKQLEVITRNYSWLSLMSYHNVRSGCIIMHSSPGRCAVRSCAVVFVRRDQSHPDKDSQQPTLYFSLYISYFFVTNLFVDPTWYCDGSVKRIRRDSYEPRCSRWQFTRILGSSSLNAELLCKITLDLRVCIGAINSGLARRSLSPLKSNIKFG